MCLLSALLGSIGAYASEAPGYSFVQVSYVYGDLDDGPNFDGLEFRGSLEAGSHVHVFAGYRDVDLDPFLGIDVESTRWDAGVGVHKTVVEESSFFATAGYVHVELDSDFAEESDDGFGAAIGIRSQVSSRFEVKASVFYVNLSEAGDDTGFNAGVVFNITDMVSLAADYFTSADENSVAAGVRLYFGKH